MAPVKFTKPPDLSGRTPIYRLSKTAPTPPPPPQPAASQVNHTAPPYHTPYHPSPYGSPYHSSQHPPHSTPQENKENAPVHTPNLTPGSEARGSPLTKRRGRKLQESEVLILVNCCLEYQSIFHDNPSRFWYCVAVSLKRQIKRNFSWQSCRQIIEELVSERRERQRDVAAGKVKEQPLTELVLATDKWISFSDAISGGAPALPTPTHTQSLKRPGQSDSPPTDANAAKRPKQNEQGHSIPPTPVHAPPPAPYPPHPPYPIPPHQIPPAPIPTIPSGPTMSEFQTLKVDIQSLRMDVQSMRREMIEVRNEFNAKFDLILQTLQEAKDAKEPKGQ
ncbi:hypothetical protein BJY01DRAFT_241494 [Aspergillus pseudoustus]|uniref:Uncharacterized protein n=1 Tax=Aspergillus pseudoustus TaxID=1810923 RepID=A0ABR4ID94_9EURO